MKEWILLTVGHIDRKQWPDAAIFEHALDDLGVDADRAVFLDDNQVNVDGARAVGLRAERTQGPDEARAVLVSLGVLDA